MNERIKELKERARDFYLKNENWNLTSYELHQAIELKFAELIVRECAEIANSYYPPDHIGEKIKEYFGVEGEK